MPPVLQWKDVRDTFFARCITEIKLSESSDFAYFMFDGGKAVKVARGRLSDLLVRVCSECYRSPYYSVTVRAIGQTLQEMQPTSVSQ